MEFHEAAAREDLDNFVRNGKSRVFIIGSGNNDEIFWSPFEGKLNLTGIQYAPGDLKADDAIVPGAAAKPNEAAPAPKIETASAVNGGGLKAAWWNNNPQIYAGSRSTPTVDEDRGCLVPGHGLVGCYSTTNGAMIWTRTMRKRGGKKWFDKEVTKWSGRTPDQGLPIQSHTI